MNYKLLLVAGAAALSYGFVANAEISPYVGIKAGVAFEKAEPKLTIEGDMRKDKISKTQFVGSAEVGLAFKLPAGVLRTEVEYTYHPKYDEKYHYADEDGSSDGKIKVSQHTFMVNAYYDLPVKWAVVPYIGGGIGYNRATVELKLTDDEGTDKGKKTKGMFAWNIGAGLGYNITKNLALDIGYRYMDGGKWKKSDSSGSKLDVALHNHQIYAGLRYTF